MKQFFEHLKLINDMFRLYLSQQIQLVLWWYSIPWFLSSFVAQDPMWFFHIIFAKALMIFTEG